MASFTPTDHHSGSRESASECPAGPVAVAVGRMSRAVKAVLQDGLAPLGLPVVDCAAGAELRDTLFDLDVAVVLVQFRSDLDAGAAVCRTIRRHPSRPEVPVIALVDESTLADFPLDCGADDVLRTDCSAREAGLRVRLCLWRRDILGREGLMKVGDVVVDVEGMAVTLKGLPVDLTYKEFSVLRHFLQHPGVALSRGRILDAVWGRDYLGGDRTVDIHVRRLRAKLPPLADCIQTVHGVGYRYAAATDAPPETP